MVAPAGAYQLLDATDVDRIVVATAFGTLAIGAVIPADPRNEDWRDYLQWKAAGNTPLPKAS
jgi:hypothetical protein